MRAVGGTGLKKWFLVLTAVSFLALPGAGLRAEQPAGFVLLSAGKDGAIGTPDDLYVTGRGEVVRGRADLAALGVSPEGLVPSSSGAREEELVFVPGSVVLTADRASAPADGETAVTLTAEVREADGSPAPDGTEVVFSATAGTLSATSAATSNGAAAVTLVSSSPGTSVVTATCGGVAAQASVEFYPPTVSFAGGQASCSSYYSSDTADKAFDGNLSTWWKAPAYFGWVQYSFGEPVSFSSARIVTSVAVGTAGVYSGTETVTLKASMDGVTWTTLASKAQPYSNTALYREFSFEFARATAKHVRIEITRSRDWVTVVEVYLYR